LATIMAPRASPSERLSQWLTHPRRRLVILLGAGSLLAALFVAGPSLIRRTSEGNYVPLTPDGRCSAAEFRAAQAAWKQAGLTGARYAEGVITIPAREASRYREVWAPAATGSKSHWADVWQSAASRLSQFSGSRERADAREISRAQVVSRLLEELPDIATADVVWDEVPAAGWRSPPRARATVYLRPAEGCAITPDIVDAVRRAVCGSKANLDPADVAVMDQTRMITYDGAATTAETERAVRLAALYRARLETALQHFPGLHIRVQADPLTPASPGANPPRRSATDSESTSDPPQPPLSAKVMVTVPESTIRTLAGLGDPAAAGDGPEAAARSAREIFRSVEQHIAQVIRTKAPLLLPPGLVLVSPEHLHVETVPLSAPPAAPPRAVRGVEAATLTRWLFPLIAVVCGGGALWMLRPRRQAGSGPPQPASSVPPPTSTADVRSAPESLANPGDVDLPPARSVSAADGTLNTAVITPGESEGSAASTSEAGKHNALSPAEPEHETAAAQVQEPLLRSSSVIAERRSAGRTAVLHDVLARLQSRPDRSATAPPPRRTSPSRELPRDLLFDSERRRSRLANDVHPLNPPLPEITGVEQLVGEPPELLRRVIDAVDLETWGHALFGTSRTVQAQLLSYFSPTDADDLTRFLSASRPIRLRDLDAAQERVLAVWRELRQELPLDSREPAQTATPGAAA
jgi:hypothetical protein